MPSSYSYSTSLLSLMYWSSPICRPNLMQWCCSTMTLTANDLDIDQVVHLSISDLLIRTHGMAKVHTGLAKASWFSLSSLSSRRFTSCAVLFTSSMSSCIFSLMTFMSSDRVTVLLRSWESWRANSLRLIPAMMLCSKLLFYSCCLQESTAVTGKKLPEIQNSRWDDNDKPWLRQLPHRSSAHTVKPDNSSEKLSQNWHPGLK